MHFRANQGASDVRPAAGRADRDRATESRLHREALLGTEDSLVEIQRILREGNGADEQRRIERQADIDGLLARLLERSR